MTKIPAAGRGSLVERHATGDAHRPAQLLGDSVNRRL